MVANMTDPTTRIARHNGKWHIMARKGVDGVAEVAWVSLGSCPCQPTAVRVWLACQAMDNR